jgi:hypothetical protein
VIKDSAADLGQLDAGCAAPGPIARQKRLRLAKKTTTRLVVFTAFSPLMILIRRRRTDATRSVSAAQCLFPGVETLESVIRQALAFGSGRPL